MEWRQWKRIVDDLLAQGATYHNHPQGVLSFCRRRVRFHLPPGDVERDDALALLCSPEAHRAACEVLQGRVVS